MIDTRWIESGDSEEQQGKQKQDYRGNRNVLKREIIYIRLAVMSASRDTQRTFITPKTKHSAPRPRLGRDYILLRRCILGTHVVRLGRICSKIVGACFVANKKLDFLLPIKNFPLEQHPQKRRGDSRTQNTPCS